MAVYEPLNSYLYRRLGQLYGTVKIANPGVGASGSWLSVGGHQQFNIINPGEYYRINCPFCAIRGTPDVRQRLWIHHRWGVGMADGHDDHFWWAAVCYNENCLAEPTFLQELRSAVYYAFGGGQPTNILVAVAPDTTQELHAIELPTGCVSINQLPDDHAARRYLQQRGFDPTYLANRYGLQYCQDHDPRYPYVANRIITPIVMRGELVGWQSRYVGETDWRAVPKYYTCPGMAKRMVLYDYDEAKKQPFICVTEGVTDAWAVGDGAVALLGKTMSYPQCELLQQWPAVVLILDADAVDDAEDVYRRLADKVPVVRVTLPTGTDPASIDKDVLWDLIYGASTSAGIDLLKQRQ